MNESRLPERSHIWIWIFPVAAVAFADLSVIMPFIITNGDAQLYGLLLIILGLIMFIVSAVVAIVAHRMETLYDPMRERKIMLLIKLGTIPFYVIGGCMILTYFMFARSIEIGIFLFLIECLSLLITSVPSICYALSLRRIGTVKKASTVCYIIMQFFFVLDVVAAVIMFITGRRCDVMKDQEIENETDAG